MQVKRYAAALLALALLSLARVEAWAQSSTITFPDLPSGTGWITTLTSIFISAAGLGLGIVGLGLVIRMIRRGLKAK